MSKINIQVFVGIICRKDSIWNIYVQSTQYIATCHTEMVRGYMDWTYLAYVIGIEGINT